MTSEYAPGIVIPLRRSSAAWASRRRRARTRQQQSARPARRQHGQQGAGRRLDAVHSGVRPGALFEIGDGHGAQGDGEVDQTAIETSLRGRLQLDRAQGHEADVAARGDGHRLHQHGRGSDLTVATKIAIQEMVDFLAATKKLTKHQAYQVVSLAGNVAVTQLVDKPTSASTSGCRRASSNSFVSSQLSATRYRLEPERLS
jgi:hypothetical protein